MTIESDSEKDIDQLIYAAAEHKESDIYHLLYEKAVKQELFFSLVESDEINRKTSIVKRKEDFKIPTVLAFNDMKAVVFYTRSDDARLSKKYAGMLGRRGMEMIMGIPDVDGIIIQNSDNSWVAILKEEIEKILDSF